MLQGREVLSTNPDNDGEFIEPPAVPPLFPGRTKVRHRALSSTLALGQY